jgi:tetratricopeptide (TPR) repeat protein
LTGAWRLISHRRGHLCSTVFLATLLVAGCSSKSTETPQQRAEAARRLFEETVKQYHQPSASAQGAEAEKLREQALRGYAEVLEKYPEQTKWAAQALRSTGNLRVVQGRLDDAVRCYADLEKRFPAEEWEILQAWKCAADTLWDANRRGEALSFYRKIIQRFDQPAAPPIYQTIVRGSKARLAER